jgi:hypothetical protein
MVTWPSPFTRNFSTNPKKIREPTSGLKNRFPLLQLRVITQTLQGFARGCKSRIFKGVSFPCLAACCTVLRSRWYQPAAHQVHSGASSFKHFVATRDSHCSVDRVRKLVGPAYARRSSRSKDSASCESMVRMGICRTLLRYK